MITVVIPTLNAAETLGAALACLEAGRDSGLIGEGVVSDGGSQDAAVERAKEAGAKVISGPPGRGGQLQRGAVAAGGEWLLFLHSDTVLDAEWLFAAEDFIADSDNGSRAAVFRFALDDDGPSARRLERLVAWRWDRLGLPYGDQGLLLSRRFYGRLGGFRDIPLMEDVDLVRRVGRRRLVVLDVPARTSAQRYRREGYWRRSLRNLVCLGLFFLHLPPRHIAKLYG